MNRCTAPSGLSARSWLEQAPRARPTARTPNARIQLRMLSQDCPECARCPSILVGRSWLAPPLILNTADTHLVCVVVGAQCTVKATQAALFHDRQLATAFGRSRIRQIGHGQATGDLFGDGAKSACHVGIGL